MDPIATDGLTKRFGDIRAVDAIDLHVETGEVFGFLGPNGAGKSTTINMLLGFLNPSDGAATVLGSDVTSESKAIRQRTGLLPEGIALYDNLTGREHVVSAIETKGGDDDPDTIIDRVGLAPEAARRPAGTYSKGMAQRLSLGIALVDDPDLLILDEPSTGLDPNGAKLLRDIVREEADRGATVFFSSHILGQVEQVCDRVGIMHQGRLTATDTIENLRDELRVESTIRMEVAAIPDLETIESLEGITDVSVTGSSIEVTCTDPTQKMAVLRSVDAATTVTDIRIDDASLETLFQEYTAGPGGEAA